MSSEQLLDRLQARVGSGWSRSTGDRNLLTYVEMGRNALVGDLMTRRTYRGEDNQGDVPFLLTVDGTYKYFITGANLSCGTPQIDFGNGLVNVEVEDVSKVCVDVTRYGYDDSFRWIGVPQVWTGSLNPYTVKTDRISFCELYVAKTPATRDGLCSIQFVDNPGTTSNKYFIEFIYRLPSLLSEYIPLGIPQEFEDALEDYVIARIQESEHGGASDMMRRFYDFWVPKFRARMARGSKLRSNQTSPRYF